MWEISYDPANIDKAWSDDGALKYKGIINTKSALSGSAFHFQLSVLAL